jgi:hypothetical protein
VVVLVLLAAGAGLALLPFGASTVRLRGVSLVWWYAGVFAPGVAVVVTTLVLLRRRPSDGAAGAPAAPAA